MQTLILICMFHFAIEVHLEDDGCAIYPFEVDLHPLIVVSGASDFIYPGWGENVLRFKSGESVDVICPGRAIIISSLQTQSSVLSATCVVGTVFKINSTLVQWNQLRCNNYPWRTIRDTGNKCANNGREIEAGFAVGDNRFLRSLLICFNQQLQIAYYTFINQTASINERNPRTPRPFWLQGFGFYTIGKVTKLYLRPNQKATVNRLLGLSDHSSKYIKDATNYFLARGHLTARSDCFYAAQQNATFFMQNIAPQWQTFNGFNWKQVEIDVRDYAETNGVDLQVWTGVHGIATLPHEETGEDTELYLFVNETTKALPVPEIFWKVVYNPITEEGIAMIGVNNPYISTFARICEDLSDDLSWFNCKKTERLLGFCYACSISSFRQVVTVLPEFSVKGLLL